MERLSEGPVILTQRGRGTAVLLSMARWQQLVRQIADLSEAMEDAEDIQATDTLMQCIQTGSERTYSHEEAWAEVEAAEAESAVSDQVH